MNFPNQPTRRDVLRVGLAGAAGIALAGSGTLRGEPTTTTSAPAPKPQLGKAKSVIQIWMWGGPPHTDTFDPKPNAGYDYTGNLKAIDTNVPGIQVGELLPLLAQQADKYSIVRGMTHGNNGHETAAYIVQTCRAGGDNIVWPSIGAVVTQFKGYSAGYKSLIPPYIVMTQLQGRFSEVGFLPLNCKPFPTGGDPARTPFNVEGVVVQGITEQRQRDRRKLLEQMNTLEQTLKDDPQMIAAAQAREQAYELVLGSAGKVFDASDEKDDLRERYGRNTFGQSCLIARRLVEKGVPYITINYGGWDTHKEHFQAMRRKLPDFDKGLATLLQDLKDRRLLDSTIVFCCGEFGRSPKIAWESPWNGGRHHWGQAFSVLVAGGGFKAGQVIGATDEKGEKVKDRPVYPPDLLGSIYLKLGIDPDAKLPHPQNKDVRVIPTASATIKRGGYITEIM